MDRLKVLVIDDEPGIRMAINRSLQNYVMQLPDLGSTFAFDVIEAGTGEEGLECLMSQNRISCCWITNCLEYPD